MSEAASAGQSRPPSEKVQRLRLRFARGPEAAGVGHLDLARMWERALREAGVHVFYSRGNRPQPSLTLAAGLPVGVTSDGELMDVVLAQRLQPAEVVERVRPHLPAGLEARDAWEVGLGIPSLPSAVRWADYEVALPVPDEAPDVPAIVASFLEAESFPWEDTRREKVRRYDLRPLVLDINVREHCQDVSRLWMRLRCDTAGVGRVDQVVKALGLPQAVRIHRLGLVLAEFSPARDAWRRRGRYVS